MSALQARGEGYEVFAVTDASGGVSGEAHEMAVRRMVAAGIVPITRMAAASEWQGNWARSDTFRPSPRSSPRTVAAAGLPLRAWEMQLLGSRQA